MLYKGRISSINHGESKGRVLITEINYLTNELQISPDIKDIEINDDVIVAFLGNSLTDGVIINNLSKGSGNHGTPSATYIYTQLLPVDEWIITHNLNKYPSVTIVDSSNSVVMGEIKYIDENKLIVCFNGAFSGKAYIN